MLKKRWEYVPRAMSKVFDTCLAFANWLIGCSTGFFPLLFTSRCLMSCSNVWWHLIFFKFRIVEQHIVCCREIVSYSAVRIPCARTISWIIRHFDNLLFTRYKVEHKYMHRLEAYPPQKSIEVAREYADVERICPISFKCLEIFLVTVRRERLWKFKTLCFG